MQSIASLSLTRRSFLKSTLAAATGLAVVGVAGAQSSSQVRLGIIGTGGRGTGLLQLLLLFPQAEIRAVCDLVPERAERARKIVEQKCGRPPEAYSGSDSVWEKLVARSDLDAIVIATPWEWHARMAVAAMKAGKYPAVEVPAAITLDECWDLVRTSEKTRIPCTMLENVCYFRNVMALLQMVRANLFGDVMHCEAGYQHDCRSLMFDATGNLTWRGQHAATSNGNHYPTHALGPVAQWLNINRGDRFVSLSSVSTASRSLKQYAIEKFGPEHPAAKRNYREGDVNTSLLKTAKGRTVTLYYNLATYRPYDLIQRIEGVKGIYLGTNNSICLDTGDNRPEAWEPFAPYQEKYDHPLWKELGKEAEKSGGHGGAEYLMFTDFLRAVQTRSVPPQDVYDAATWSAIFPLSITSVAKGGKQVDFPDFTRTRWEKRSPI